MPALLSLTLVIGLVNSDDPRVTASKNATTVAVSLFDYAAVPAGWLSRAQDEMTRIYGEIGVSIVWQEPAGAPMAPPQRTLIVVISPDSAWIQKDLPQGAIGFASDAADRRGRVAYVLYDRMEQFRLEQSPPIYRARILGHLMAHEVGHLLLPFQSHSPQGLMRARWDRADLERVQEGRLRFTPEEARLIRSKISEPGK